MPDDQCPDQDVIMQDTSRHRLPWEQPDQFVVYMGNAVLGETSGT